MSAYDEVGAEERLRLAASVFANTQEGLVITDPGGLIVDVNPAFTCITGYSREEVVGHPTKMLSAGRQTASSHDTIWQALRETGFWRGEMWSRDKDGAAHPDLISISAVCDGEGNTSHYVGVFSDITHMKQHEAELERIAHCDPMTNLPNRLLLADRLQQAVVQSQRHGHSLAIVYLDLDGFKAVNDQYGHDVGDELLITVAQRMKKVIRGGDTLARIGGDEFVAVLVDLERPKDCEPVLARLLRATAETVTVRQLALQISASIGVTFFPEDNVDIDQLLSHADQAMYRAKQAGRNRYHLFDGEQDAAEEPEIQ